MSSRDDSTGASQIRPSGEWNQFSDIIQRLERIERKQDGAARESNEYGKVMAVMENRLEAVESWRRERESVGRQWTLGTWLSIVGSIAGPVATFIILGTHK